MPQLAGALLIFLDEINKCDMINVHTLFTCWNYNQIQKTWRLLMEQEFNPAEEQKFGEEYYTSDLSNERYDGYNYRILVQY